MICLNCDHMRNSGFLKIIIILLAVTLLLDWYVFSGLKTLTANWRSDRWRQLVRWGYLIFSLGITVTFVAGLGSFQTAKGMPPFHEWILSLFLTLLLTRIFFCLVLFLGDLGRFFYGLIHSLTAHRTTVPPSEPFF